MASETCATTIKEKHTDIVFEKDEMQLRTINAEWTEEELLDKEGIFYLKDVANKLNMSSADFKKKAADLELGGQSAWEVMGIRKAWTHWIVRMKKFGHYLKNNSLPRIQEVKGEWDGNQLLSMKGQFYLSDVCEKIPFTSHQIRYQARQNENAREEFGVWKDPAYKTYIVEMEAFSKWIARVWRNVTVN